MPRLPRFTRSRLVRPIDITGRDLEILTLVARHRFLRSTHIIALLDASAQRVLRRLQLLYHHGYLERPRAQLEYYKLGGSQEIAYGLGSKGAKVLSERLGEAFAKERWGEKNRSVGRMFLRHAFMVSDVLVAFQLACRASKVVRYIPEHEISPEGVGWRVALDSGRKFGVVPDAAFALVRTVRDGSHEQVLFFLEADRGTMPVTRKQLFQTSFRRKFLTYQATWLQGIHRSRFSHQRFRMLTIGTSNARLATLRAECAKLERGKGLFLFLHKDVLSEPTSLLNAVWMQPHDDSRVPLFKDV